MASVASMERFLYAFPSVHVYESSTRVATVLYRRRDAVILGLSLSYSDIVTYTPKVEETRPSVHDHVAKTRCTSCISIVLSRRSPNGMVV